MIAEGLATVITTLAMATIAVVLAARRREVPLGILGVVGILASSAWALLSLNYGDRNTFLLVALSALVTLSLTTLYIGRSLLALLMLIGFIIYQIVENSRSIDGGTLSQIVGSGAQAFTDRESSFNISAVSVRAALALSEETGNPQLGTYKLVGVLGIFPFIRGYLFATTDGPLTSADALTSYLLPPSAGWSVGSNVIADIYLDLGLLGLIICMLLLGWVVGRWTAWWSENPMDPYRLLMYSPMVALVAELPRYSLDFPVRPLFWLALLVAIVRVAGLVSLSSERGQAKRRVN
ncbi:hypothetical protein GCM10027270_35040 [Nocardioides ginkgobilobae]